MEQKSETTVKYEVEKFDQWRREFRLAEHGHWPTDTWFQRRLLERRVKSLLTCATKQEEKK